MLFGSSGLYRTTGARVSRLPVDEVKPGAERRVTLPGGVDLLARGIRGPDGPGSAYRLSRDGATVVLAGEVTSAGAQALATFAAGARLMVASLPTLAAVRALGEALSTMKVGALLVIGAGDEVRR